MPDTRVTRRAVVATGAKLAYAAPFVAASVHLSALGAAADTCTCTGIGAVFDETPYGGSGPACCTCEHCTAGGRGGPFGDVLYPGAVYLPDAGVGGICASTRFPRGFSIDYCAPICTPCGSAPSSPR